MSFLSLNRIFNRTQVTRPLGEKGVTLLEVVVASTILMLVIWGSSSYLSSSKRLAHELAATTAVASYEDKIVQEIFFQTRLVMSVLLAGTHANCNCVYPVCFNQTSACNNKACSVPGPQIPPNASVNFGSTGTSTFLHMGSADFTACDNFYNMVGAFHWAVQSGDGIPTNVAPIPEAVTVFQRCTQPTVSAYADQSSKSRFYFCVMVSADSKSGGHAPWARSYANVPDENSFLRMEPIIVEFSYFSVVQAPIPGFPGIPVGPITLANLALVQPSVPQSRSMPIMDYLYYDFHWTEQRRNAPPAFHSHLGYVTKGEGWY